MKTAYTEYRVVISPPEDSELRSVVRADDATAAHAAAEYFTRHGLSAYVEARDVSEWRREDV